MEAEVTLQLKHMLAACGIAAIQIVGERARLDAQLTGGACQDLRMSVLADAKHTTPIALCAGR